jgi:hypothetical protein
MRQLKYGKPFTALALILVAYSTALHAQAVQSLYSPVILVHESLATKTDPETRPIQMREDGSGFMRINSFPGDLSHVGGAGGRYFLGFQNDPEVTFPGGFAYADFVAWHENGDPSTVRVLTSDRSVARVSYRWSVDGKSIVFGGRRFDSSGNLVESGAFLGEVEWVGGEPVRVYNERLVATDLPSQNLTVSGVVADPTGQRIVFSLLRDVRDDQGRHVRSEFAGMFVAAVPPVVAGQPLPPPATPIRILLPTPDAERGLGEFAPVQGDERLLFTERAPSKWPYISYLWTVEVPQGYDGTYALTPKQVTTKTNSTANYLFSQASWSPTGAYIAFTASRNADWTANHVYRIVSDGRGKAIRLTTNPDAYAGLRWRP